MDNKCISFLDMIFATQLLQQAKNSRQMDYNLSQRMNNLLYRCFPVNDISRHKSLILDFF